MAEVMGVPEISEIDSRETLEAYLKDKPIEWSRQVALRSAFRVFPFVLQQTRWSKENHSEYLQLVISAWRCLSISLHVAVRPNIDLRDAASAASAANAAFTSASAANASFAASAASAAFTSAANASFAAANANAAAAAAASFAAAAADAAEMWKSVRNDLYLLSEGTELLFVPLYKYVGSGEADDTVVPVRSWHRGHAMDFAASEPVNGTQATILSDWYLALLDSGFSKTPWGEIGSDIDLEIAEKGKEFWDGEPDDVMTEIASIVGWPEYGREENQVEKLGKDETVAMLAAMSSPEPRLDENKLLDIQPNQEFDLPFVDDDLTDLPQTLATLARTMSRGIPPNAPLMVKPSLEEYSDHLFKYGAQPILGTVKALAEIIEADFKSRDSSAWSEGLQKAFEKFWESHLKLIEHFPRDLERIEIVKNTNIDEQAADSKELIDIYNDLWAYVPELYDDKQVTQAFAKFMKGLEEQFHYARTVPPRPLEDEAPSAIKRFTLRAIGVFERMYGFVGSTASIAGLYWGPELLTRLGALLDVLKNLLI